MKLIISLILLLSFWTSQATGHQCLGACADQNSKSHEMESSEDHSCCEDFETQQEDSSESHNCDEGQCLQRASLHPEVVSFTQNDQELKNLLLVVFNHSDLETQFLPNEFEPPSEAFPLRPKHSLGLYIVLKRLRFC